MNAKNCQGTRDKKWSYKFEDLSKAAHVKWFILSLLSLFLLLSFWKISVRFRVFKMSQLDTIGKIKMLNEVVTNLLIWMWSIQSTTKSKTTKNCMHTCTHWCTDTHRDTNTHITQTCFTSFGHKLSTIRNESGLHAWCELPFAHTQKRG